MERNAIGVDKDGGGGVRKWADEVEFRMRGGKSVRVGTDWLFVLGMTKFPSVIDVTQMEASASSVLEQIISGNRRLALRINMRDAAEIAHVSAQLKFANLLKLIERDLLRQSAKTQQEAVDSLCMALRFGMTDAVGKLVDDIVFSFYDENLLMCCKSPKALELIINRKASLLGDQETAGGASELMPPVGQDPNQFDYIPPEDPLPIAPRRTAQIQFHKVFLNATKQKLRTVLNRPVNIFRSGVRWVSTANRNRFRNFHEQFN